jgi:PPOX class probable F420-dependent enzyme
MKIPESHQDLFTREKRAFAFLSTVMADGSPQVTPVWFDLEGETLRINTARGRVKDINMSHRPAIALAIMDPDNPYRYIQVRGTVVGSTEEGAREHIDRLAGKYLGKEKFSGSPNDTRVIYFIQSLQFSCMG